MASGLTAAAPEVVREHRHAQLAGLAIVAQAEAAQAGGQVLQVKICTGYGATRKHMHAGSMSSRLQLLQLLLR